MKTFWVESYVEPFLKGSNRHRTATRSSLREMAKYLNGIKGDKYVTRVDGTTWSGQAEIAIASLESKEVSRVQDAREFLGEMLAAYRNCLRKYGQKQVPFPASKTTTDGTTNMADQRSKELYSRYVAAGERLAAAIVEARPYVLKLATLGREAYEVCAARIPSAEDSAVKVESAYVTWLIALEDQARALQSFREHL